MARRKISVSAFRGEPVEIEFEAGTSAAGEPVKAQTFPVRGDLPMEVVNWLAAIEEESQDALQDGDGDMKWMQDGQEVLERLIREMTPAAVLPALSPQELLGVMGALVGGESVGQAIAQAMSDGLEQIEPAEPGDDTVVPLDRPQRKTKSASVPRKRSSARSSA